MIVSRCRFDGRRTNTSPKNYKDFVVYHLRKYKKPEILVGSCSD